MGIAANNLQSFRPYHPGELVKEELECRGIRQKDFVRRGALCFPSFSIFHTAFYFIFLSLFKL